MVSKCEFSVSLLSKKNGRTRRYFVVFEDSVGSYYSRINLITPNTIHKLCMMTKMKVLNLCEN